MITILFIIVIALLLSSLVAVPLIFPKQADPLPDLRDPLLQDLEEERDALFRAIRELDAREDTAPPWREQLRARYEAKAARVLRAIDERQATLAGSIKQPRMKRPQRIPYATLALLGLMMATAAALSGYVLPRVGGTSTVTTSSASDLQTARALQKLQRDADRRPTSDNLLALADAYWQLGEAEQATKTYQRIAREIQPVPAIAYRRLGFLSLQSDLSQAQQYLQLARQVDPEDLDTLYALGEVELALGKADAAREAWQAYLALPQGQGDEQVLERMALLDDITPLLTKVEEDASEENLMALADAYWRHQERERAVEVYFRVLTDKNPINPLALGRTGQLLFIRGRNDDAIRLLERARELGPEDPNTLLFLGNAYSSQERYQDAITAWREYVTAVGGETNAGRVPDLIAGAEAQLALQTPGTAAGSSPTSGEQVSGEQPSGKQLYLANCATCHGATGQGGSGPVLAGNRRAADVANVLDIIRYGRGAMPGLGVTLSIEEQQALTAYVTDILSSSETSGGP